MTQTVTPMREAAAAWRDGRILVARRGYEELLGADPEMWGARFQLYWLDASFGRLPAERAQDLADPRLGAAARDLLAALIARAAAPAPLHGHESDWDIETLRVRLAGQPPEAWQSRAEQAWRAGLHGVAHACLDAAGANPDWRALLDDQLGAHLHTVAAPFAPT